MGIKLVQRQSSGQLRLRLCHRLFLVFSLAQAGGEMSWYTTYT